MIVKQFVFSDQQILNHICLLCINYEFSNFFACCDKTITDPNENLQQLLIDISNAKYRCTWLNFPLWILDKNKRVKKMQLNKVVDFYLFRAGKQMRFFIVHISFLITSICFFFLRKIEKYKSMIEHLAWDRCVIRWKQFHRNGLVWFYGISTIVGYLMPNPLYTYILNI